MRGIEIGRGGPWKSRLFWALKWHERSFLVYLGCVEAYPPCNEHPLYKYGNEGKWKLGLNMVPGKGRKKKVWGPAGRYPWLAHLPPPLPGWVGGKVLEAHQPIAVEWLASPHTQRCAKMPGQRRRGTRSNPTIFNSLSYCKYSLFLFPASSIFK